MKSIHAPKLWRWIKQISEKPTQTQIYVENRKGKNHGERGFTGMLMIIMVFL